MKPGLPFPLTPTHPFPTRYTKIMCQPLIIVLLSFFHFFFLFINLRIPPFSPFSASTVDLSGSCFHLSKKKVGRHPMNDDQAVSSLTRDVLLDLARENDDHIYRRKVVVVSAMVVVAATKFDRDWLVSSATHEEIQ